MEPKEKSGGKKDDCEVIVTFDQVRTPEVTFFFIDWRENNGTSHVPNKTDYRKTRQNVRALLPIPNDLNLPPPQKWIWQGRPNLKQLLLELHASRLNFVGKKRMYYGLLVDPTQGGFTGLGRRSGNVSVGYYLGDDRPSTVSHELGHNFGRRHTLHTAGDGNCNKDQPKNGVGQYDDGHISQVDTGNTALFGFDIFKGKVIPPTTYDLMSYCKSRWISDITYKGIKTEIEDRFGAAGLSSSSVVLLAGENAVLVSGFITPTENSGTIETVINTITQDPIPTPTPGSYTIRYEDNNGQQLAAYSFDPEELSDGSADLFSLLLPRITATARIVLLHNAQELDARVASANVPDVTVASPNGGETLTGTTTTLSWTANDLDGDPLEYIIQYSADAGATWEILHPGWLTTSYELDLGFIPGSSQALIRVLANDGFHTGQDQSDATFSVIRKAPIATIYATEGEDLFTEGQTIILDGDAFDYEDGQIPEANLTWSSNLDGNLGTGESLSVDATLLSAGVHTLTLTAQDSDGMTGADSVSIAVEKPKTVTYTVNTTADVIDANVGDGLCDSDAVTAGEQCSLRAAIQEANAANNHSLITLQPGIYYLTLDGENIEDQNANGDLDIALNPDMRLTIAGPDPDQAIIDARYTSGRVFQILGSTVVISGVTIQRGTAASNPGSNWRVCCGGGLMLGQRNGISSDVSLINTRLTNNSTTIGGGGAVYARDSRLTVRSSEISGNTSAGSGGGVYGIGDYDDFDLTLIDSLVSNNSATVDSYGRDGAGGGVYLAFGDLVISNTTFTANTAAGIGGGFYHSGPNDVIIFGSTFSHNTAGGWGGAFNFQAYAESKYVVENSLITHNSAGDLGGGFYGNPLLLNSVVSYNQADSGGGIYGWPTLINSQVVSNTAVGGGTWADSGAGGGIYSEWSVPVTLIDSIVSYNSAATAGGGIANSSTLMNSTVSYNSAGTSGGGIKAYWSTVINSAIHHNSAAERGGGLYVTSAGSIRVINSTISSNSADIGGGFDDRDGITASGRTTYAGVFSNTTVSNNTATSQSGGIHHETGTLTLENTLLANNSGGDCGGTSLWFYSNGHNLASDDTCTTLTQTGDLTGTNPQLGPLQNNGGSTLTHAIPQGSPAEDAGNNASCPTTDQRGYTRYNGNGCDIGAYEYMPEGSVLWVNPYSLTFQIPADNTAPISRTIGIGNPEELIANWTANESIPWLNLSAASGQMPAALDVIIDSAGLTEGVYTGSITVASADLQDSPQTVGIAVTIGNPATDPGCSSNPGTSPPGGNAVYLPLVIKSPSGAPSPANDSNNVSDAATACSGQPVSGQVSPTDRDDVFKIYTQAGQRIDINLTGSGGDADLGLYAPDVTNIYSAYPVATSASGGSSESISYIATADGYWYIDVYAYSGTIDYTLTATVSDASGAEVEDLDANDGVIWDRSQPK